MKRNVLVSVFLVISLSIIISGCVTQEETKAAYGYSTKATETEAVAEAVSMIKSEVPNPDYVILYSTVGDEGLGMAGYDSETVLSEANRLLPGTKIYGGTSHLAVLTRDGYHQSENAALAMLAISSPDITFGVGGVDIDDYDSAKDAGKAAMENAIKDAGREGEHPDLVLIMGSLGNEEALLEGIEEVIGWGIPVIGGSAASNTVFDPTWREFTNDDAYFNGVTLTAIFTDMEIGYFYETGYDAQDESGTITRAEGRTIYEIDNQPAADVYNEWCDGCIAHVLETGGSTMPDAALWALAKVIKSESGTYYLSVAVVGVGDNKSLSTVANVMSGDEVLLMHGNPQSLVNKAKVTSQKAMSSSGIAKGEPAFGISITCAGLQLATPQEDISGMPSAISSEIGEGVPFIGAFTNGEQGPLGIVNHHGNLINSIIVFG